MAHATYYVECRPATMVQYHCGSYPHTESRTWWLEMQHTILPFDLQHPVDPVLLDVDALYQHFVRLTDHRQQHGRRYALALVLTLAVPAKLAGADDLVAIAAWARVRASELNARFRRQRTSMPHPTTGERILSQAVDPAVLTRAVAEVPAPPAPEVPARGSILLVLDGKTLRGTIPPGSTWGGICWPPLCRQWAWCSSLRWRRFRWIAVECGR